MVPSQLNAKSFESYPPQARAFAGEHLAVLQQLPLGFLPSFLREASGYDWKMPAERAKISSEMQCLAGLSSAQLAAKMQGFSSLRLNAELEAVDWINSPSAFLEQLTAWLWSTHQMDGFHAAADAYTAYLAEAAPPPMPAMPRLAIVVVGQGVAKTSYPPFRKLRPNGVYFSRVKPEGGLEAILSHAAGRAQKPGEHPGQVSNQDGFAHWYIDGGTAVPVAGLKQVSFDSLGSVKSAVLGQMQQTIDSGGSGPEALRSLLAKMTPGDVGMVGDPVLDRFQLSLLTEGSGTQIFSTTFVQWAGRECLRRAQPETLVLRYAPRQQAQPMNAMLSGAPVEGVDAEGSLIDADMGAYYTWLNLRRLSGANQARFLVWFEGRQEAVAIGPDLPRGTVSDSPIGMQGLLKLLI